MKSTCFLSLTTSLFLNVGKDTTYSLFEYVGKDFPIECYKSGSVHAWGSCTHCSSSSGVTQYQHRNKVKKRIGIQCRGDAVWPMLDLSRTQKSCVQNQF
ncbi:hypothetical protein CDAR_292971 [Caerostris darwini]|uniref:Uncharacterized protein n=1 Tax=Caerostris darwini TaxID=1538125 RepID=A0AAV4TIZ7_9ARAC|nr:hypothetical protein CDAR_292971 [Caerostris darwini]